MLKLIQIFDERPFPLLFFSYIAYFFLHFTNSPFSPYIRGKLSAKQKISFIYTTGIPVGPRMMNILGKLLAGRYVVPGITKSRPNELRRRLTKNINSLPLNLYQTINNIQYSIKTKKTHNTLQIANITIPYHIIILNRNIYRYIFLPYRLPSITLLIL